MTIKILPPTVGFVINGVNPGSLMPGLYADTSGYYGPWGYPINQKKGHARIGCTCRDIFLADVMNWSCNPKVHQINNGIPTYSVTIAGNSQQPNNPDIAATREELRVHLDASIKALQVVLTRWIGFPVHVKVADMLPDWYIDDQFLVVTIRLPQKYWGNLLMASFLAAVCRTWLHMNLTDESYTVASMWKHPGPWTDVMDYGRFNISPSSFANFADLEAFATFVKAVGGTGCPLTNPGMFLGQSHWSHYFQAYFSQTENMRKISKGMSWHRVNTIPLGCTTALQGLMYGGGYNLHLARASVWPICPEFIGFEHELNMKAKPQWLRLALNGDPVPNAAPEARTVAETTSQFTPTGTRGATRVVTGTVHVAR